MLAKYLLVGKENSNLPSKAQEVLKLFKENFWIYQEGYASTVFFTPLKEIYFSNKDGNWTKTNSKLMILVIVVIVILILFYQ